MDRRGIGLLIQAAQKELEVVLNGGAHSASDERVLP